MTVNELYRSFLKETEELYNKHEAANITAMIFEHFAGIDRAAFIKNPGFVLDEKLARVINSSLEEVKAHKPVQYIVGAAWFYKIKFKVSPAVLIPRPETEELVEEVLNFLGNQTDPNLLDIGTGSGCIAIAIKKSCPGANITATDISDAALKIANKNAATHNSEINFLQENFLDEKSWQTKTKYEVIVSNPPYIPLAELKLMPANVSKHEPHTALFADTSQPLIFYEKIAAFGKKHLNENGKVFVETHEDFADDVNELFRRNGYDPNIKKDMFGKQRMVIANLSR